MHLGQKWVFTVINLEYQFVLELSEAISSAQARMSFSIAGLLCKVNKECVKAPGGKGALIVLATILPCVDGTGGW